MAACMSDRGFEYAEVPWGAPSTPTFLYALADIEEALNTGYRITGSGVDAPEQEGSAEFVHALAGEESNLMTVATPEGAVLAVYDPDSCQARVTNEVMPGWERSFELALTLDQLVADSAEAVKSSDLVAEAWEDWSACMAGEGYDFGHPWAPFHSVWPGVEPGEEEIAIATADVECKQSDEVLERWSAEMARVQQELLDENHGVLEEWLSIREQWLAQIEEGV